MLLVWWWDKAEMLLAAAAIESLAKACTAVLAHPRPPCRTLVTDPPQLRGASTQGETCSQRVPGAAVWCPAHPHPTPAGPAWLVGLRGPFKKDGSPGSRRGTGALLGPICVTGPLTGWPFPLNTHLLPDAVMPQCAWANLYFTSSSELLPVKSWIACREQKTAFCYFVLRQVAEEGERALGMMPAAEQPWWGLPSAAASTDCTRATSFFSNQNNQNFFPFDGI